MKRAITISMLMSLAINAIALNAQAQFINKPKQDIPGTFTQQDCSSFSQELVRLKALLKGNPSPQLNIYQLGVNLEACENFDDAITAYRLSNQSDSKDPSTSVFTDLHVAGVLVKQQKLDEALALYQKAWANRSKRESWPQSRIEARAQNDVGSVLIKHQQLDLAQKYLDAAIRLDPTYAPPYRSLGQLYVLKKQSNLALEMFEKSILITNSNFTPQQRTAKALFYVGAVHQKYDDGQRQTVDHRSAAKRWFRDSISTNPNDAEVYDWLARLQSKDQAYDDAIATLKKKLAVTPSDLTIHQSIAHLYVSKNEIESALSHFKQAMDAREKSQNTDPDAYAQQSLGYEFEQRNRYAEAAKAYEQASLKSPTDVRLLHSWGTVLLNLQQWEEAVPVLERARTLLIQNNQLKSTTAGIPISLELAVALGRQNRVEEALAVLKPLIDLDNFIPSVDISYGILLTQAGRQAEATDFFKRARGGSSLFYWGYFAKEEAMILAAQARAYATFGRYQEAIPLLQKAIAVDPNFAYAYGALGKSLRHVGRYDESVVAYEKALQLQPWKWEMKNQFWSGLGVTWLAQGQLDQARDAFQQALKYQSENTEAQHGLGLTELEAGNYPEAIAAFKKVLAIEPHHTAAQASLQKAEQL